MRVLHLWLVAVCLSVTLLFTLSRHPTSLHAVRVPRLLHSRVRARPTLKCLVLTFNVSVLHPSTAACTPFIGTRFSAEEFTQVSAQAQMKLRDTDLQERASDLTNNASVNIFMNHVRIWRTIADSGDDRPVLVLEEDVILSDEFHPRLVGLIATLRDAHVANYIVKLHSTRPENVYSQWTEVYNLLGDSVRTCTCRPAMASTSAAAYLLDRQAARVLLKSDFPLRIHVDVYTHEMGCILRQTTLHGVLPNWAKTSGRPSTHLTQSWQRSYLMMVESIENMVMTHGHLWLHADQYWESHAILKNI